MTAYSEENHEGSKKKVKYLFDVIEGGDVRCPVCRHVLVPVVGYQKVTFYCLCCEEKTSDGTVPV